MVLIFRTENDNFLSIPLIGISKNPQSGRKKEINPSYKRIYLLITIAGES